MTQRKVTGFSGGELASLKERTGQSSDGRSVLLPSQSLPIDSSARFQGCKASRSWKGDKMALRYFSHWEWPFFLPILAMASAKAIGSQPPAQTEPFEMASASVAALSKTTPAPLVSMDSLELLKRARGLDTCGYWNGSMLHTFVAVRFLTPS